MKLFPVNALIVRELIKLATDAQCQPPMAHKLIEGWDHWVCLVPGAQHKAGHIMGPQCLRKESRASPIRQRRN